MQHFIFIKIFIWNYDTVFYYDELVVLYMLIVPVTLVSVQLFSVFFWYIQCSRKCLCEAGPSLYRVTLIFILFAAIPTTVQLRVTWSENVCKLNLFLCVELMPATATAVATFQGCQSACLLLCIFYVNMSACYAICMLGTTWHKLPSATMYRNALQCFIVCNTLAADHQWRMGLLCQM